MRYTWGETTGSGSLTVCFLKSQHRAWCSVNVYLLKETTQYLEHPEEKVTFELGVEEQGEDGDVGKEFPFAVSSVTKSPSLDTSKI